MDVRDKQQVIIELLLLEGYTGEKIVVRLRSVYGSAASC
jgi:hypothetical protein